MLMMITLFNEGLGLWSFVPLLIGGIGILADWGLPPIVLFSLVVFLMSRNQYLGIPSWSRQVSISPLDGILALITLVYLASAMLLMALVRHRPAGHSAGTSPSEQARARSVAASQRIDHALVRGHCLQRNPSHVAGRGRVRRRGVGPVHAAGRSASSGLVRELTDRLAISCCHLGQRSYPGHHRSVSGVPGPKPGEPGGKLALLTGPTVERNAANSVASVAGLPGRGCAGSGRRSEDDLLDTRDCRLAAHRAGAADVRRCLRVLRRGATSSKHSSSWWSAW